MFYLEVCLFSGQDVKEGMYALSGSGWMKGQRPGKGRETYPKLGYKHFVLIDQWGQKSSSTHL